MCMSGGTSAYCSLQKERRELLQGKAARGGFGAAGQPRLGWLVVWFAICLGFYCLAFWPGTFLYCLIVILCDCHAAARWPTTPWLFVWSFTVWFSIVSLFTFILSSFCQPNTSVMLNCHFVWFPCGCPHDNHALLLSDLALIYFSIFALFNFLLSPF